MPGLLRGVARTAVIAGTATAVSNRVSRRQVNRWQSQENAQYGAQQQPYPPQQGYAPPPPQQPYPPQQGYAPPPQPAYATPPPVAAAAPRDPIAQLKDLAELKSQGILTEAEFDAQKAKILAG